jgi:fatty-acyl-CoA synthase
VELNEVPVEVRADIGVDGPVNLFALLAQTAQRFPDRGAVYHGERRCCTWQELRHRALHLAGSIRRHCPTAARIAIISENRPEIVELLFGIWAAECVAVPINYKLHPREMIQILEDAGVSQVFASATIAAQLASDCGFAVESLEAEAYSRRMSAAPATAPCTDPSTLAWLFYTSGTTGRAKGAMLTHRNLMAMTIAHLADIDAPDEGCSLVHAAPMSHGSGLYIPAYVLRGARQVVPQPTSIPERWKRRCWNIPVYRKRAWS